MTTDPLSDILDLLGARCILSGGMSAGGAWIRHFARPEAIKIMALTQGTCWLQMEHAGLPSRLETGDVIVVNGRHALTLMSAPDLAGRKESTPLETRKDGVTQVGTTSEVRIVAGQVAIDAQRQNLLLDALPPLIHIAGSSQEAATLHWLLDRVTQELAANLPGASSASAQLAQLIFVEALRANLRQPGPATVGWLRGLADRQIAVALGLMHAEPARNWTLIELSRAVGMSRTSFAERFSRLIGVAPLAYLTGWRMHLAEHRLRREPVAVATLAATLGYRSESAFSTAFKRATGLAPRRYLAANRNSR